MHHVIMIPLECTSSPFQLTIPADTVRYLRLSVVSSWCLKVYKGSLDGNDVAVKFLDPDLIAGPDFDPGSLAEGMSIATACNHNNIVRLLGAWFDKVRPSRISCE